MRKDGKQPQAREATRCEPRLRRRASHANNFVVRRVNMDPVLRQAQHDSQDDMGSGLLDRLEVTEKRLVACGGRGYRMLCAVERFSPCFTRGCGAEGVERL